MSHFVAKGDKGRSNDISLAFLIVALVTFVFQVPCGSAADACICVLQCINAFVRVNICICVLRYISAFVLVDVCVGVPGTVW